MPSTSLPVPRVKLRPADDLRAFVERHLGPVSVTADCSSPRDDSRVWRLAAGRRGRVWYLKRHSTPEAHAREVHAYARWAPALGPEQAARLRAADSGLAAIVLTALPGINPFHHMLPPDEEQEVHRQLGLLLDALHHCAPRRPAPPADPLLGQVPGDLAAARFLLSPADDALIARMAARMAGLPPEPYVPTHGDAQVHNTVWDPDSRMLALLDFERAGFGPAVRDFGHLAYGPWYDRPDLRRAFFTAYGPEPTSAENERLQAVAALDALGSIALGVGQDDPEAVGRGRRTLARLHEELRV